MTVYELRVYPIPHGQVSAPEHTVVFTAASSGEAEARMDAFAAELAADHQVFLYEQGVKRSIASEDGLAEVAR